MRRTTASSLGGFIGGVLFVLTVSLEACAVPVLTLMMHGFGGAFLGGLAHDFAHRK